MLKVRINMDRYYEIKRDNIEFTYIIPRHIYFKLTNIDKEPSNDYRFLLRKLGY